MPEPDFEFSQQRQQPGGRVSDDIGGRGSGEHHRGHAAVHAPPAGQRLVNRESSSSTDKSGEVRRLPLPPCGVTLRASATRNASMHVRPAVRTTIWFGC